MEKSSSERRGMRLAKVGLFALVVLGVSSGTFVSPPTVHAKLVITAQISPVPFTPVVGELVVPIYNWAPLTQPPPPPPPPAPAAVHVDPGSAQATAKDLVLAQGWGEDQFSCLFNLWNRESSWRANAANPSSGAYGIPQSLPGSKMASAGADWETNPVTQIKWGLGYISTRYGNPCGAWAHSEANGWY